MCEFFGMAASAPRLSPVDDLSDPLLAAALRAPLVPLTDHERALLAEVQGQPITWISSEDVLTKLSSRRSSDDAAE